ncbi:uncharacterized protein N7479_002684 [Penicillium vulpinum]|uniref:uncharacterized protein n=1 Tax=Penicillium vulpinum TaxID=29845 RepID=UPI002548C1DD|nr:uncharacterized protein N7479_002684 [Penicillium vulpinum]KAJ5972766.1 hypothetical protein N7479_002684 [Penicillium vulpinum]
MEREWGAGAGSANVTHSRAHLQLPALLPFFDLLPSANGAVTFDLPLIISSGFTQFNGSYSSHL